MQCARKRVKRGVEAVIAGLFPLAAFVFFKTRKERWDLMRKSGIVAIDLETTGFSPFRGDRVIEVGAVVVESGVIAKEFHTLVRVPRTIPRQAWRVHGITDRMLDGQPLPEKVYPAFRDFIADRTLVAHNAQFDLAFLAHELARLGMALPNRSVCTLRLARRRLPGLPDHRLETVYRHLFGGFPRGIRQHRALDDAQLTAMVWLALGGG